MTHPADNPFAPPTADTPSGMTRSQSPVSLGAIARATFLAWEKLRWLYVAVLVALTLLLGLLGGAELFTSRRFWFVAVEGAVAANVCYLAGPAAETYIT